MTKQIVPLNIHQKNTQKEKKHTPILKLRKGKLEYILYDTMENEQLEWVLQQVLHHVNSIK